MRFFSYDPEDGFEFHATEIEAAQRAHEMLECHREVASEGWPEGWPEGVTDVCWGTVESRAFMERQEPDPSGHHDYLAWYEMGSVDADDQIKQEPPPMPTQPLDPQRIDKGDKAP